MTTRGLIPRSFTDLRILRYEPSYDHFLSPFLSFYITRTEPDFGVILSRPPFNCKVFAFDPSPTTQKWYASDDAKELREQKNYYLFLFGGGYEDGSIELKEYNWDQVSIYQYPNRVVDNTNCTSQGKCRYHKYPMQKVHHLPVRSVQSVMKEFGHTKLDVLKLDVEGSEYRMLEALIQSGACRVVDQISLEWHHYDFDLRYGASSNPQLNVLHTLLKEECGIQQFWLHDAIGWPSNEKIYADMKLILRYNLAAFHYSSRLSIQVSGTNQSPTGKTVRRHHYSLVFRRTYFYYGFLLSGSCSRVADV